LPSGEGAGTLIGIDSASARVNVEEDAMTDTNRLDPNDLVDAGDTVARDPDRHSTWNTIDRAVDVDEVLDEDDLKNFFIEPIPNPLDPAAAPDDSGATS
jgi:hypothetical protein